MVLSDNARVVLERRYLKKDENGVCESPEDMIARVAKTIAAADKAYNTYPAKAEKAFYDIMSNLQFMPNSPTLMNAGRELGQLSACFVLPIEDSMEGIFGSLSNAALIHKSGGGTGFSFSRIRRTGASVNSTGGVASGPVSFMKVYNASTEAVKQGGTRRGANMGILRVDHPDIMEFITCKSDLSQLTNFNISVGMTEEFMQAVIEDREYSLVDPATKKVMKSLRAKEVYDTIVDMAWQNGEPGIVFLDRINKENPVPSAGEIESTNPCGEQPLLPYESCNLGSINLNAFVRDGQIEYDMLGNVVKTAVHFLDNVIDVNKYPLKIIEDTTKSMRKIGLGVMGFADMLYKLSVPYNSDEAIKTAKKVMAFIKETAVKASEELGRHRGSFPMFEDSVFKKQGKSYMRNATVTTIAPTGTISIIAGTSSGIEPVFAISYIRNVMDDDKLVEVHSYFEQVAKERGFYSKKLMEEIAQNGALHDMSGIPKDIQNTFVTAHDITPEYHIRMQSAFQESTDNAVSKTVNFPKSATKDDVRAAYDLAYSLGLKGVTIYRDGSRSGQVLSTGKTTDKVPDETIEDKLAPRDRPEITKGITKKIKIGCGNLYVTVNYDKNGICEVFTNVGRAGGCPSQSEATSRLVSMSLRSGVEVSSIIEQLRGIRCHSTLRQRNEKGLKVLSCPDAIGRVLEQVVALRDMEEITLQDEEKPNNGSKCPECASKMEHEGGCVVCRACGYSKCG